VTEKKEELLKRLGDLRKLSKEKKYRLAKTERDEVLKTLSEACLIGLEGIRISLEALPDFPSDTGAECVTRSWAEISTHPEEFYKTIQGTRYKTDLGKRLRLLIGQHLSSKAPDVAMHVIFDVCKDMMPTQKRLPTSKDLNLISSTLLADGASVLARLPLDLGLGNRSVQLVSYCLGAGFSRDAKGKSLTTQQTQLALIRWANGQQKFLNPDKEIQGLITARVRTWNDDFRKLLGSELDALHPSLRNPINDALVKSTGSKSHDGSEEVVSPVLDQEVGHSEGTPGETAEPQTNTIQKSEDIYDVLHELERMTCHIKKMHMDIDRSHEEVARLDRCLQKANDELERTRRDKEEVKRSCDEFKDQLEKSLALRKKLEQSVNSLKEQIENLNSKLIGAENRHDEMVESHKAYVDVLHMRISQEGEQCLAIFRNKMAGMLRPFAFNLKEALSMEMTHDLGITMRTQLKQILNIMKSQGITI